MGGYNAERGKEQNSESIRISILGAMGILLILGMCLFGLDGKRLIGIILLEVLAVVMHICKMQKDPNYIKHILGLQSGKDRIHEYDWLRIFAVVMVIITHAIQIDLANGRIQDEHWVYILTVLYVFVWHVM